MEPMAYFCELLANAKSTYRLKPRYYWLTTGVGLAAVTLGCALLCVIFAAICSSPHVNSVFGIALFFASIPFVFYAAGVCVAGIFGAVLIYLQHFTLLDAINYALISRYPRHWFKQ
jgi:hypothetical protein